MAPMTEERVREIIRQELAGMLARDRFIFQKHIQILDGKNIQLATGTGTKIGTATTQKIGFYNTTPVAQQTGVAVTAGAIHTALVALGLITA